MFEWSATIVGRPASKKNNRRNFRRVSLPSQAYERFNREALSQLDGKTPELPFDGLVALELHLYLKGRLRQDYDNAAGSIGDILQDAGIITDDDHIDVAHVYKHRGAKEWRCEIRLTELDHPEAIQDDQDRDKAHHQDKKRPTALGVQG